MNMQPHSQPSQPDLELSYFDIQAYMGTTKHMGGLETTRELIELCHIGQHSHVLDVGCGVGATACYLVQKYGCSVTGIDRHESMVAQSQERAKKEGVEQSTRFRVADARDMPFQDSTFDAVLCESVLTFVEEKQRALDEFARVLKPGGWMGLNEEYWRKTPPPPELVQAARRMWNIEPAILTLADWKTMLENAGLDEIIARPYQFNVQRESTQVKRYHLSDMWNMFYRTLTLYFKNPAFRQYLKRQRRLPKKLFDYLGYGVFVGRKIHHGMVSPT